MIWYTKRVFYVQCFQCFQSHLHAWGAGHQPPQASFGASDEVGGSTQGKSGEMTGRRKIGAIKNWYLFNPLHIEYNDVLYLYIVCSIIDSISIYYMIYTWFNQVFYVREIDILNFQIVFLGGGCLSESSNTSSSSSVSLARLSKCQKCSICPKRSQIRCFKTGSWWNILKQWNM